MPLTILCFGPVAAITQQPRFEWPHAQDTASLQAALETRYPALQHTTYRMAVNKCLHNGVQSLEDGAEIALLPPFSGG